ncbi:MAG: aminoacyl-tRNA hydrolase [Actinomycetota bacterium]|nr:aminoacyl-tRNA hydrolase [Actinomycetota bacterium]
MESPLRVTPHLEIPPSELSWRFSRSSGPGGQGVNTTDSRVELSWDLEGSVAVTGALRDRARSRLSSRLVDGVLTVSASEHRSQLRNREAALERLAELLRAAVAPPPAPRRATRPTLGSQRRRVEEKKRRGETKRLRRSAED